MPSSSAPGFAGMYMLHRLRGLGFTARGVRGRRAASAAPGTGTAIRARAATSRACSIPSRSRDELEQEWDWSRALRRRSRRSSRYANHVADRFDLRRDIHVRHARHRGDASTRTAARWTIETDRGDAVDGALLHHGGRLPVGAQHARTSRACDDFRGPTYHTGDWPHEGVDFTGKRVGVIGTGSSAIQSIPIIAQQAAQLTVFQRTPNYSCRPATSR